LAVIIWILDRVSKNVRQRQLAEANRPEELPEGDGTSDYANVPVFDPGGGVQSAEGDEGSPWYVDAYETGAYWGGELIDAVVEGAEDWWDWATDW